MAASVSSSYQPRYWLLWLGMGILWLLTCLPYRWQLAIGKNLGLLAFRFAHRERQIATINIEKCFPDYTAAQKQQLLRENFMDTGMATLETAFGWWGSHRRLKHLLEIHGWEYVTQALKEKKGVLLCAPHMNCLHIVGRLLNEHHRCASMFFPPKNIVLRTISLWAMQKYYAQAIPRNDARQLIKALKKNMPVLYTPDTDAGLKNSIFAPFFGIPTATVTATARFAHISDCKVICVNYWRQEDGKGYQIHFSPALTNYPTPDPLTDATRINQILMEYICQHPAQYLWQYKRFKTRPPGEAKFYPSKGK